MSYWGNKKVVVLGGAGFVGSHLVRQLIKLKAKVLVVDNFSRGLVKNLNNLPIIYYNIDLKNPNNYKDIFYDVDVVMNLVASVAGIEYNRSHQGEQFSENMLLQINPLKAACGHPIKRFLQVSTACIYPNYARIPTIEEEGYTGEPEPTNSGYGWAKRMGEKYAEWCSKEYGIEMVIARPSNVAGINDYYDDGTSHVIPALIKKILRGDNPVILWGTGTQKRSFVNVKDVAKGLILVTEYGVGKGAINIGLEEEITMLDLTKLIMEEAGIEATIQLDKSKPDGYHRRLSNITKLYNLTGWKPSISIRETVKEMIEDYRRREKTN